MIETPGVREVEHLQESALLIFTGGSRKGFKMINMRCISTESAHGIDHLQAREAAYGE